MSVWTVPITWANGAVTAAQMNSLRDNLIFLKGFADLITGSTAADTGTATMLEIHRGATGNDILRGYVLTEANPRYSVAVAGRQDWGAGGASVADTSMQRTAAGELTISNNLRVNQLIATNSGLAVNLEGDGTDGGYLMLAERIDVATSNINPNHVAIYARDVGGKTQIACRFNTGNPIPMFTQT